MYSIFRRAVVPVVLFVLLPFSAKAQGVVPHSIELSFTGGVTNEWGIDNKQGHALYGGAGAYNLTKHLALVGEYSYVKLGTAYQDGAKGMEHSQLFGAAVRYAPINTRFVVPYVLGGGGGDRSYEGVTAGDLNVTANESGGYVAVGGGASFYVGHGFGVRPEFRYNWQQYGSTVVQGGEDEPIPGHSENDLRATVAIFYQFGGRSRS
jgi:hypothetical protein